MKREPMKSRDQARMDWVLGAMNAGVPGGRKVLILGGTRIGKSRQVEVRVKMEADRPV